MIHEEKMSLAIAETNVLDYLLIKNDQVDQQIKTDKKTSKNDKNNYINRHNIYSNYKKCRRLRSLYGGKRPNKPMRISILTTLTTGDKLTRSLANITTIASNIKPNSGYKFQNHLMVYKTQ